MKSRFPWVKKLEGTIVNDNIWVAFKKYSIQYQLYEGVSKIFQTDAVKIINLTTKRVWKLPASTQLRATWHTDSLDMVVLPSTGASRYHNCCIDGGASPKYFGYTLAHSVCLNNSSYKFLIRTVINSMNNQQTHKRSTISYTTLVTMPLHVSTLLLHPPGGSCPVPAKLHKHLNAESVTLLETATWHAGAVASKHAGAL
jgi:hypothetical protein